MKNFWRSVVLKWTLTLLIIANCSRIFIWVGWGRGASRGYLPVGNSLKTRFSFNPFHQCEWASSLIHTAAATATSSLVWNLNSDIFASILSDFAFTSAQCEHTVQDSFTQMLLRSRNPSVWTASRPPFTPSVKVNYAITLQWCYPTCSHWKQWSHLRMGLQSRFQATILFSIRAVSLASSQSGRSVVFDARCKRP